MYSKIQQYKLEKCNKSQAARRLGVNIKTVIKYWDITPDEYSDIIKTGKSRSRKLDSYRAQILSRLQKHPDFSAAQIHDWLKETYPEKRT